jgi:hypothetical protein
MIIFPFGFYVLDGKIPVYVGNDLEAQATAHAWMEANPEQIRLGLDQVGPMQVLTIFHSSDHGASRSRMDQAPLLFETTICGGPDDLEMRRRYNDYEAALEGHAELVGLARSRLS